MKSAAPAWAASTRRSTRSTTSSTLLETSHVKLMAGSAPSISTAILIDVGVALASASTRALICRRKTPQKKQQKFHQREVSVIFQAKRLAVAT